MQTMPLHRVLLFGFILSAAPNLAGADDWNLTPGKGSIVPDPSFSNQLNRPDLSIDSGPWTAFRAISNPETTPTAGKIFISPDKRFSVEPAMGDREFDLVIKDARMESVTRLTSDYSPIFCLEWSPDSKTLLAVDHASMTSLIGLAHWDGHRWQQFEIDAPEGGDNDKFHVIAWEFKRDYLAATYLVDHRTENGQSLDFYTCAFHIDPTNGQISHVTKKAITQKEFLSLRNASN